MTDRAEPPVSQEEILDRLSAMTKELAHLHATAVKYPALKKILGDVAAGLPADTRMPGIRDLAERLGISLVTAQRAVAELAAEEVLYSRPRSGNFVRGRSAGVPPALAAATQHPFRAVFSFATDSTAPYQREFWEELAGRFSARHPNATPSLRFADDSADVDRLDAHERYDRNITPEKEAGLLDLAGFAGGRLPAAAAPVRGRLLPLYYRTYFLFWNQSLLERHGLPAPAYRTFADQAEYLRSVAPALERLGLESQPYSIQEPVTLLGSKVADYVRLLGPARGDARLRDEVGATLERLLDFCRLLHYSKGNVRWVQARRDFVQGREPFFLGYSVDYWEFSRSRLPFALEAYPTLCCDDALFLWPRVGTVARRSEHPVESLNFLLFLLDREAQARFASTGNFGAGAGVHPATAADPGWLDATRRRSAPFQFATREDYYMAINVLGDAIWRSLIEGIPAAETLEQALRVGASYLQHRATA